MIYYWLKNAVLGIGVVFLLGMAHFPERQWFSFFSNSAMLIIVGVIISLIYGFFLTKEDKNYAMKYQWYVKVLILVVIVFSLLIFKSLGGIDNIFSPGGNLFYLLVGVGLLEIFISGQKHFNNKQKTS